MSEKLTVLSRRTDRRFGTHRKHERFFAPQAWLDGNVASNVRVTVHNGRVAAVESATPRRNDDVPLPGLMLPGFANTHSHAFHRALRGRTHEAGTFWTWRERMYAVAGRIDPDQYYELAKATYCEMALAGITAVGEFHYLHHGPDGRPYSDPNLMGHALRTAAREAGIRITLLDTCYLTGGIGVPLEGPARRFGDGSVSSWADRVSHLAPDESTRIGAAIHSVRAVPRDALPSVVEAAAGRPLHVHLSEQPAENDACLGHFGLTPTRLLGDAGVWSRSATAVHATHLTEDDIKTLGSSGTTISMCCTTERDLADGVGPAVRLAAAGSPLCVGSDAHMAIDLWEEARAIELDERLVSGRRGNLAVPDLARALTEDGAAAIGWDAGRIAEGALGDLVTVSLDSPRTAGARHGDALAHVVFAATAADVTTVVVGGDTVVRDGRHLSVPDVGLELERAIGAALGRAAHAARR